MATALNVAAAPKPRSNRGGGHAGTAVARAPTLPPLTAEQIVERNVTARGGLAAWKGRPDHVWKGKMGAGGTTYMTVSAKGRLQQKEREEMQLPYRLEFKRPLKSDWSSISTARRPSSCMMVSRAGNGGLTSVGTSGNPIAPTRYGKPPPNRY